MLSSDATNPTAPAKSPSSTKACSAAFNSVLPSRAKAAGARNGRQAANLAAVGSFRITSRLFTDSSTSRAVEPPDLELKAKRVPRHQPYAVVVDDVEQARLHLAHTDIVGGRGRRPELHDVAPSFPAVATEGEIVPVFRHPPVLKRISGRDT